MNTYNYNNNKNNNLNLQKNEDNKNIIKLYKCNKCGFVYISDNSDNTDDKKNAKCPVCQSTDKIELIDDKKTEEKGEVDTSIEYIEKYIDDLTNLDDKLEKIKYDLSFKSSFKDFNKHFEDCIIGLSSLLLTSKFIDNSISLLKNNIADIKNKDKYINIKKKINRILNLFEKIDNVILLSRPGLITRDRKRNKKKKRIIYQHIPLWAAMDSGDYSKLSSDRNINNAAEQGSIDNSDVPASDSGG